MTPALSGEPSLFINYLYINILSVFVAWTDESEGRLIEVQVKNLSCEGNEGD